MSGYDKALDNAARLLLSSERGYARKYGSVPIDTQMDLAGKWIDLALAGRPTYAGPDVQSLAAHDIPEEEL